jgi:dephospho-CoA kinase
MNLCDAILFVKAPFITRLIRARRRDHLPFRQILRRFHAQKNLLKEYKKTGKQIIFFKNR